MTLSVDIIVLNWNRSDLLRKCLDSILENANNVDRIIVIDNNSSDDSRDIIQQFCRIRQGASSLMLPENIGALGINDAIEKCHSDLIFIVANDKILLDGWQDYACAAFEAFPALGQLALHSPAPLDDEVWVTKPSEYMYSNGLSLQRAIGNTGLSSVIKRELVQKFNLRFDNISNEGPVRLPDDGKFSQEIVKAGFFSAWSDRYYVINVGHTIDEFERDWKYYENNYDAKASLKIDGLKKRIDQFRKQPVPLRTSRITSRRGSPDWFEGMVNSKARNWSTFGDDSFTVEAADFAYAICRLVKPSRVAVVRGWFGYSLVAVCKAVSDNGLGTISCFEPDDHLRRRLRLLDGTCEQMFGSMEDISAADMVVLSGAVAEDVDVATIARKIESGARWILADQSNLATKVVERIDLRGWSKITFDAPRKVILLSRHEPEPNKASTVGPAIQQVAPPRQRFLRWPKFSSRRRSSD